MSVYRLETFYPAPPAEVYALFSNIERVSECLPPFFSFEFLSATDAQLYPGQLFDYRLRLFGGPFSWRTLIDEVHPGVSFSDRQLIGPFRCFRHRHEFQPGEGGTWMVDHVDYQLPVFLGWAAALVSRWLRLIFLHRQRVTLGMFGAGTGVAGEAN